MITGPKDALLRARELRASMSLPEVMLWKELRKRPGGFKFRRQHPAGRYVLDFYCAAARLAIEVDGWGHDSPDARSRDDARSAHLRSQGIATVRVPATVIMNDTAKAVDRLVEICAGRVKPAV